MNKERSELLTHITLSLRVKAIREDMIHNSSKVFLRHLKVTRNYRKLPKLARLHISHIISLLVEGKALVFCIDAEIIEKKSTFRERKVNAVYIVTVFAM